MTRSISIDDSTTLTDDRDDERTYALAVKHHSERTKEQSLYPGDNYRGLADFLWRPFGPWSRIPQSPLPVDPFDFLVLQRRQQGKPSTSSYDFDSNGIDELRRAVPTSGDVLFLQGIASPEWLNLIGSKYGVDPEFFRRHLYSLQRPWNFDLPSFQSSSMNIITLPLMSIGHWGTRLPSHLNIVSERQASSRRDGHASLIAPVGSSIIRQCLVLSPEYFAIDQTATIHVHAKKDGKWEAIVWSDCGRVISSNASDIGWRDPCNKIHQSQSKILPVSQFKPKMFIKADRRSLSSAASNVAPSGFGLSKDWNNMFQSAALLPKNLSQDLDRCTAQNDSLYALSNLFAFSAISENQFLNAIEHIIDEDDTMHYNQVRTTSNLEFYKRTLDARLKILKPVHTFLRARGRPVWPRAENETQAPIAEAALSKAEGEYLELIQRVEALSRRCLDESLLLMNKTMIKDTQSGLIQAQSMRRLTLLAYFFIPLSYTSSFFGMNFTELQDSNGPRLSVWTYFIISIPISFLAIMFYFRESFKAFPQFLKSLVWPSRRKSVHSSYS